MAGDGRREAADAGLQEDMGRRSRQMAQRLAHDHRIALHDQAGNALIARPGCVGDDGPAPLGRDPRGLRDRIVVAAGDADHLGAEAGDRRDALVADAAMDEDHRPGADQLRALRHRAAMIAVGRAGEGHAGGDPRTSG